MSTDKIVRTARELCEMATPGPWEWTVSDDFGSEIEAENLKGVIGLEDDYPGYPECGEHLIMNLSKADATFIALSRTLIPELCDLIESMQARLVEYDAPTIDAVEVVRCGECSKQFMPDCPLQYIEKQAQVFICQKDGDFCSYGEKMEVEPCE